MRQGWAGGPGSGQRLRGQNEEGDTHVTAHTSARPRDAKTQGGSVTRRHLKLLLSLKPFLGSRGKRLDPEGSPGFPSWLSHSRVSRLRRDELARLSLGFLSVKWGQIHLNHSKRTDYHLGCGGIDGPARTLLPYSPATHSGTPTPRHQQMHPKICTTTRPKHIHTLDHKDMSTLANNPGQSPQSNQPSFQAPKRGSTSNHVYTAEWQQQNTHEEERSLNRGANTDFPMHSPADGDCSAHDPKCRSKPWVGHPRKENKSAGPLHESSLTDKPLTLETGEATPRGHGIL